MKITRTRSTSSASRYHATYTRNGITWHGFGATHYEALADVIRQSN